MSDLNELNQSYNLLHSTNTKIDILIDAFTHTNQQGETIGIADVLANLSLGGGTTGWPPLPDGSTATQVLSRVVGRLGSAPVDMTDNVIAHWDFADKTTCMYDGVQAELNAPVNEVVGINNSLIAYQDDIIKQPENLDDCIYFPSGNLSVPNISNIRMIYAVVELISTSRYATFIGRGTAPLLLGYTNQFFRNNANSNPSSLRNARCWKNLNTADEQAVSGTGLARTTSKVLLIIETASDLDIDTIGSSYTLPECYYYGIKFLSTVHTPEQRASQASYFTQKYGLTG